ncbi:hypothetical protein JOQ06_009451, partial [Pogonophryne albipinna]
GSLSLKMASPQPPVHLPTLHTACLQVQGGAGRLAPLCSVPATHQAWPCSPLHLPYALLLCSTRARGQKADRQCTCK